jgi:hypothetical protein
MHGMAYELHDWPLPLPSCRGEGEGKGLGEGTGNKGLGDGLGVGVGVGAGERAGPFLTDLALHLCTTKQVWHYVDDNKFIMPVGIQVSSKQMGLNNSPDDLYPLPAAMFHV